MVGEQVADGRGDHAADDVEGEPACGGRGLDSLADASVQSVEGVAAEHDLVRMTWCSALEEGRMRGALEWVDGDEGVERYRADGRVALTGAGEDRDRRVGPDETVAGEERLALGFTIG